MKYLIPILLIVFVSCGNAEDEYIDVENKEVVDAYNLAKTNGAKSNTDSIDAEIVEDMDDSPEKILAS